MSTTVDERVVEMRFDNKHFESNVSTSMSTLDKLKQKLNLTGASKGLEDIDKASKKVNMSAFGSAVDSVGVKFSALQVMATTALANITNSAVNAGKRIVSALTIDPIRTGFQEYETQINSVQTILSNTESKGTTIDQINEALDELNRYADKTIYNFTEMTRNIGTFTAAGIDLETSVSAIQGIANLAAQSGSTSQQASTAMYQLSQALAAGTVKLMDWNSVVNAGMGGELFQNALKETSKLLGTGAEAAIEATGSFRESLREGWLTSEVLTETLKKFTTSGAVEYVAEYTGLTQKQIEAEVERAKATGDSATAMERASEAISKMSGKSKDEIKSILEFAQNAEDAATKVKTFTQLWDVLKESAQSGWSSTWKIIIGDFEAARNLLTPLADLLTGFINRMSDWRNNILRGALDALHFKEIWTGISDKLTAAGLVFNKIGNTVKGVGTKFDKIGDTVNGVGKKFDKISSTVKTAAEKLEYFQDIVNKVWRGDFNNVGDNPDRFDLLSEAGYDARVVQELVNKGYQYKLTMEDVEAAHEKFGLTMETTTDTTKQTIKATDRLNESYVELSDEQLKQAGLTEEEIRLYRALEKEAKKLGVSVSELAEDMSTKDGRTLLIDSFKNAGKGIIAVANAIKQAWVDVFNPPGTEELIVKLYSAIRSLNEFSKKLIPTEDTVGKLTRTFKGLFAILDIITTIIGGAFKIVIKVISAILGALDLNILDLTASIGDALVSFRNWLFETNPLAKAFDKLIDKLPVLIKSFKDWFNTFKQTPAVQKLIDAINGIGDAFRKLTSGEIDIGEFAASLGTNLAKALMSLPGIALQIGKDFIAGFKNGIGDSIGGVIKKIVSFCTNFVSSFAKALGVQSPSWKAYDTATDFFQGFINGAKNALGAVLGVLKKIGESIIKVFTSFWDYITDESGNIEWDKIFVSASMVGMLLVLKKFADAFEGFTSILDGVGDLLYHTGITMKKFGKVLDGISWDMKANALKKMAIAIALLVAAIWILCTIDDVSKLWNAVGVIAVLAVILVGLTLAMNKLSSASVTWNKGPQIEGIKSGLLQIGIAILLVAAAVKMIGALDSKKAEQGFKGLAAIAVGMIVFLAAIGGISRYSKDVGGVGKMMKQISIAMILMVIACKLAGDLSTEAMIKGALFAGAFAGFVMAITSVAKSAGNNVSKVGGLILKVAFAMALMVGVCKLAALLSVKEMLKGSLFAAGFVGLVYGLVQVTKIGKKQQLAKVNGLVLSASISMLMMVGICKLVGRLSLEEMVKGAAFVGGFIVLLGALVSVLTIGDKQKMAKVSTTIFALSVGIAILAAVCVLLSYLDEAALDKGLKVVSVLSIMMAIMVSELRDAKDVEKTMMYMALAIVAMAAAVAALSFIDERSLAVATGAMSAMMGMFALMLNSLKGIKKVPIAPIIMMIGVIVALAGVLYLLSALNVNTSIGNAVALAGLMSAMAGVLFILSKIKMDVSRKALGTVLLLALMAVPLFAFAKVLKGTTGIKTSTKTVIMLVALITAMAGLVKLLDLMKVDFMDAIEGAAALVAMALAMIPFVAVLKGMQNINTSISKVIALSILASACTAILYPLSYLGGQKGIFTKALWGVAALSLMAVPLMAFVGVLAVMGYVKNAKENVILLAGLMTVLTILLLPLAGAGALIIPALLGLAALTLMTVPMLAFISVLALMNKVQDAHYNVELLLGMMTTLTDLLARMALVGPLAIIGVTAMTALVTLVGVVGVMATAMGALMTKFPSLEEFLDKGLPIIEKIAGSIGTAIGNFISGIAGGLTSALAKMGNDLVVFTTSLSVASANAKTIPTGCFDGVKDIMTVLLEIAGTSVTTSIADVFTSLFSDQTTMEKFVGDAKALVEGMGDISATASETQVDGEALKAVTDAAQALADLQSSLDPIGGVISWFTGKSDLATFGVNVSDFFDSMKVALNTLEGLTVDTAALEAVIKASQDLSELQKSLESIGGVVDWFTGKDDLGTFGANVAEFFDSMKVALSTLQGMTVDTAALEAVIKASQDLSELQQSLESIGGVVDWFTGKDDLATFGANVAEFFKSMKTALSTLEGMTVDETALESVIKASEKLSELQSSLEPIGGVIGWFKGRDDLGTFGASVAEFATGMQELSKCTAIDATVIDTLVAAGGKLSEFEQTLPAVGGFVAFFAGQSDLGEFGTNVGSFATGMQALSQCGTIDMTVLTNLTEAGGKMSEFEQTLPAVGGFIAFFNGQADLGQFGTSITSFATGMQALSQCPAIDSAALDSIITAAGRLSELQATLEPSGGIVDFFTGRDDLGTFAETVKTFMVNMKDAFNSIDGLSIEVGEDSTFSKLAAATNELSTLQHSLENIGGVVDWFTGHDDLGTFAETVKTFMTNMRDAFTAIDGLTIEIGNAGQQGPALESGGTTFEKLIVAVQELSALQQSLENIGGVIDWFTGNDDLGTFGESVKTFMTSMRDGFNAIEGLTYDAEAFKNLKSAAEELNNFQSTLTATGGIFEFFTGKSDIGTFGTNVGLFADGMAKLMECKGLDATAIQGIIDAATSLSTFQQGLDGTVGGLISWFTGKQADIGTFGTAIGSFADGFIKLKQCEALDQDILANVITSAEKLGGLETTLDLSAGGLISWFTGKQADIGTFGTAIGSFADGFIKLKDCEALNQTIIDSLVTSAEKLADFQTNNLDGSVGGLMEWFKGKKEDLGTFGTNVGLFADGFAKLKGCEGLNAEVIDAVILGAEKLVELQTELDGSVGGLMEWFKGKKEDLGTFGENIGSFATAMGEFSATGTNFNNDGVNALITTAYRLKSFMESLKDFDDSGVETFTGVGTGGVGADGPLSDIATAMSDFSNSATGMDVTQIGNVITQALRLCNFINSLVGLDVSGIENFKVSTIAEQMKAYSDTVAGMEVDTVSWSITYANRLADFITRLVGLDASGVGNFKITSVGNSLRSYSAAVAGMDTTSVSWSITYANRLADFITRLVGLDTSGVAAFKTAIAQLKTVDIEGLAKAFSDASGLMYDAAVQMMSGLVKGILDSNRPMKVAIIQSMKTMTDQIGSASDTFKTAGGKLASSLANGFSGKQRGMKTAASSLVSSAMTAIRGKYTTFYNAGAYLVKGFASGIDDNTWQAEAKAKAMAEAAVEAAQEELAINSPSKVFKRIGSGIPEGFAMGIGMLGGTVKQSAIDMATTAISSTKKAMTTVLEVLNSDMETQPTIRPVIDLTDVRSGANTINSLFAGSQSVGVRANLNAINVAMNRKLQNGTNDDIISAIKDLNTSLEGTHGDTYNLGGITYSNGDEVGEAVQTIVRAVLMGRRV